MTPALTSSFSAMAISSRFAFSSSTSLMSLSAITSSMSAISRFPSGGVFDGGNLAWSWSMWRFQCSRLPSTTTSTVYDTGPARSITYPGTYFSPCPWFRAYTVAPTANSVVVECGDVGSAIVVCFQRSRSHLAPLMRCVYVTDASVTIPRVFVLLCFAE